ncbi:hypothetical protein [Lawsonibacter hominis]|uniref:hypothetical protein n=1 Tax=Lawsonibacter hominis TaxID=2763053 RepID=UPI00332A8AB2
MDCQDSITEGAERRKGQHLGREERGAIQHRKRQVRAGNLDLAVTELPEAVKRTRHKTLKPRVDKKNYGSSISVQSVIAALRIREDHGEGDSVVDRKSGKKAVSLSLLEKKTESYVALHLPGKNLDSVLNATQLRKEAFGETFSQVFKSITGDNGPEFSGFAQVENWGSQVSSAPLPLLGTSSECAP